MRRQLFAAGVLAVAVSTSGCQPDRPASPPDPHSAVSSTGPRLDSVVPREALYASATSVTLHGANFIPAVDSIVLTPVADGSIGAAQAAAVTWVSPTRMTATLGPVGSPHVGRKTVTAYFGNKKTASLAGGFHLYFDQDPVVFVHGCPLPPGLGSVTNEGTSRHWRRMYLVLRNTLGYPAPDWPDGAPVPPAGGSGNYLNVLVYTGAPCGANRPHAAELDVLVDGVRAATGAPKVDLVANSMGSVPARWYVAHLGGTSEVRDFVILAGANHGSEVALVPVADTATDVPGIFQPPAYDGARELFPSYDCTPGTIQYELNGCVGPGNAVDETPNDASDMGEHGIAYLNIYNLLLDELIQPTAAACLNQQVRLDCTDPVNFPVQAHDTANARETPHGAIRFDTLVTRKTIEHLTSRNRVQP